MSTSVTVFLPIENVMPKCIIQRVQFGNQIPNDSFAPGLSKRIHLRRMPKTGSTKMPADKSVDTFRVIHI